MKKSPYKDATCHMPKISIIVPVYNTERYLSECLDSILLQTFMDYEVICINDGSTDNSAKILEKYKKSDKRIKIITQKNSGVVLARNNAIKEAKGEFIYILDSDDIIEETTLEKSYKAITAGKGDIITCRVFNFGENSGGELRFPVPNKRNMATGGCLVNAALFRKELFDKLGGFDSTFAKGIEDYDFYLNACYRQNAKFYRIPEILFFYRKKPITESRQLQFEKYYYEELTNKLNIKYPEMKKYRVLGKICEFLFHIRRKKNLIIIKLFKIPLFTIKYTNSKIIYAFLGKIPVYVTKDTRIACHYFDGRGNFGDLLNHALFGFFGKKIEQEKEKNSEVVAIGSLLQNFFRKRKLSIARKISLYTKKPIIVYGSGFIQDVPTNFHLLRRLDVRAVRGYHSLEKLRKFDNVTIAENVAIGDPGLLSKYLIDTAGIEKKYDLGIIPHYVDKENELLTNIRVKNSIIIDIEQPHSKIFLKQVAECKNIISSSLHGLIAADALGIPNVRMTLSDKITGGDYKYNDYYSAFGLKEHKIINLSTQIFTEEDVVDIAKNYKIKSEQVEEICKTLISAFPYKN